ncbi:MAG: (Fe-S)-binding protein [Dehalococcoidales bacterium]|nr:(Fe-S)-binding protein [Dehalococcoidales bacterium]
MGKKAAVPAGLNYLADNIRLKDNLIGGPKEDAARWAKGLDLPRKGETIFFAGCGYQFETKLESLMGLIRKMDKSVVGTDRAMGLAGLQKKMGLDGMFMKVVGRGGKEDGQPLRDAVKVLRKLGENPAYLAEEEPCCGGLLHYMGLEEEFHGHLDNLRNKFKSKGISRIISIVPSCTHTLGRLSSGDGSSGPVVKHFCEVVAEGLSRLRLKYPRRVKATYHDPCQLGRYLGLIDEPRKIMGAIEGLELVEPEWTSREMSTCCGGGGGFEAVFPEMSEMLAVNRVKELMDTGAEIIITHCPGCIMQLKTGLKAIKADKVEVLDLAQVVAMSMEE